MAYDLEAYAGTPFVFVTDAGFGTHSMSYAWGKSIGSPIATGLSAPVIAAAVLVKFTSGNSGTAWAIDGLAAITFSGGRIRATYGSTAYVSLQSGTGYDNDQWYFAALVVDGDEGGRLYVAPKNGTGQIVDSSNIPFRIAAANSGPGTSITYGGDITVYGSNTVCKLDEVAVWNYAKFTDNGFTPSLISNTDPGLARLWHLDNDTVNSADPAAATATIPATGVAIPAAPTGTTATGDTGKNRVSWTASVGAYKYLIFRAASSAGTYTQIGIQYSDKSYFDDTAASDTSNSFYKVKAVSSGGASSFSAASNGATAAGAAVNYSPDHAAFGYSPGNWKVANGLAKTSNAGAYFDVVFSGDMCRLNFDMGLAPANKPQLTAIVDGIPQVFDMAATVDVVVPAPVDPSNPSPKHTLRLAFKSSEQGGQWVTVANAVYFTGISLRAGATLQAIPRSPFDMVVVGDSITQTGRSEAALVSGNTVRNNDATHGYAYNLGPLLGANVGVIGYGGTGITVGDGGDVPPANTYFANMWQGEPRVFSKPPDLVIINEGTNDPVGTAFTTGYTTLINQALALGPNVKVLALQPFNLSHGTDIQDAIAASSDPGRVTYRPWTEGAPSTVDGLHPWGWWHMAVAAPNIANTARQLLVGAGAGTGIVPTTAVPAGGTLMFKYVAASAVALTDASLAGLGRFWRNRAGVFESGIAGGPAFQPVTQLVPGAHYFVLNPTNAPVNLYGAEV